MGRRPLGLLALAALGTGAMGCASTAEQVMVGAFMTSAYQPAPPPGTPADVSYQLLAGDLHCHVNPPDARWHVNRDLPETARLAEEEKLDFVVLTPHVWARFFASEELRQRVLAQQAELAKAMAALPPTRTIFVRGIEYTDGEWGHVGVAFADLERVLSGISVDEGKQHPELFFQRYVAAGGVLTVNHPFTTPVDFFVPIARADLSWKPFTGKGPFPAEIEAVNSLAQAFEAYNLTTTDLRDRFLLRDRDRSLRAVLDRIDQEAPRQGRRMAAVGGSDSHSHHLRATTFVLSETRSAEGVRDALVAGRTCVRDPAACSFRARAPGGEWVFAGGSVEGVEAVEVWATGGEVQVFRNSEQAATPQAGLVGRVSTPPGSCSVLRAQVGRGYSSAIYVNCGFRAKPTPG